KRIHEKHGRGIEHALGNLSREIAGGYAFGGAGLDGGIQATVCPERIPSGGSAKSAALKNSILIRADGAVRIPDAVRYCVRIFAEITLPHQRRRNSEHLIAVEEVQDLSVRREEKESLVPAVVDVG